VGTSGNWRELEHEILKVIRTGVRPVGVAFLDAEPVGVKKFEGTQPSGCSFWRLAAEGRTFYTMYVVLRGKDLASIAEALHLISGANSALRDYARGRREQLSSH
jgi:hypothetical protein